MQKNIKWVLHTLNINIDQLATIINKEGGRDTDKPIIYAEKCENKGCGSSFFSNTQDHMMRQSNGYPNLCPGCREADRREKKRNYARNRTRRVSAY